ncbi:Autophagy protein, variant 2 [Balamuthia mandrillaris]
MTLLFSSLPQFFLHKTFGHFLKEKLDLSQLEVDFSLGIVHLKNLELNAEVRTKTKKERSRNEGLFLGSFKSGSFFVPSLVSLFLSLTSFFTFIQKINELLEDFPFHMKSGWIEHAWVTIPLRNLSSSIDNCKLELDGVYITLVPGKPKRAQIGDSCYLEYSDYGTRSSFANWAGEEHNAAGKGSSPQKTSQEKEEDEGFRGEKELAELFNRLLLLLEQVRVHNLVIDMDYYSPTLKKKACLVVTISSFMYSDVTREHTNEEDPTSGNASPTPGPLTEADSSSSVKREAFSSNTLKVQNAGGSTGPTPNTASNPTPPTTTSSGTVPVASYWNPTALVKCVTFTSLEVQIRTDVSSFSSPTSSSNEDEKVSSSGDTEDDAASSEDFVSPSASLNLNFGEEHDHVVLLVGNPSRQKELEVERHQDAAEKQKENENETTNQRKEKEEGTEKVLLKFRKREDASIPAVDVECIFQRAKVVVSSQQLHLMLDLSEVLERAQTEMKLEKEQRARRRGMYSETHEQPGQQHNCKDNSSAGRKGSIIFFPENRPKSTQPTNPQSDLSESQSESNSEEDEAEDRFFECESVEEESYREVEQHLRHVKEGQLEESIPPQAASYLQSELMLRMNVKITKGLLTLIYENNGEGDEELELEQLLHRLNDEPTSDKHKGKETAATAENANSPQNPSRDQATEREMQHEHLTCEFGDLELRLKQSPDCSKAVLSIATFDIFEYLWRQQPQKRGESNSPGMGKQHDVSNLFYCNQILMFKSQMVGSESPTNERTSRSRSGSMLSAYSSSPPSTSTSPVSPSPLERLPGPQLPPHIKCEIVKQRIQDDPDADLTSFDNKIDIQLQDVCLQLDPDFTKRLESFILLFTADHHKHSATEEPIHIPGSTSETMNLSVKDNILSSLAALSADITTRSIDTAPASASELSQRDTESVYTTTRFTVHVRHMLCIALRFPKIDAGQRRKGEMMKEGIIMTITDHTGPKITSHIYSDQKEVTWLFEFDQITASIDRGVPGQDLRSCLSATLVERPFFEAQMRNTQNEVVTPVEISIKSGDQTSGGSQSDWEQSPRSSGLFDSLDEYSNEANSNSRSNTFTAAPDPFSSFFKIFENNEHFAAEADAMEQSSIIVKLRFPSSHLDLVKADYDLLTKMLLTTSSEPQPSEPKESMASAPPAESTSPTVPLASNVSPSIALQRRKSDTAATSQHEGENLHDSQTAPLQGLQDQFDQHFDTTLQRDTQPTARAGLAVKVYFTQGNWVFRDNPSPAEVAKQQDTAAMFGAVEAGGIGNFPSFSSDYGSYTPSPMGYDSGSSSTLSPHRYEIEFTKLHLLHVSGYNGQNKEYMVITGDDLAIHDTVSYADTTPVVTRTLNTEQGEAEPMLRFLMASSPEERKIKVGLQDVTVYHKRGLKWLMQLADFFPPKQDFVVGHNNATTPKKDAKPSLHFTLLMSSLELLYTPSLFPSKAVVTIGLIKVSNKGRSDGLTFSVQDVAGFIIEDTRYVTKASMMRSSSLHRMSGGRRASMDDVSLEHDSEEEEPGKRRRKSVGLGMMARDSLEMGSHWEKKGYVTVLLLDYLDGFVTTNLEDAIVQQLNTPLVEVHIANEESSTPTLMISACGDSLQTFVDLVTEATLPDDTLMDSGKVEPQQGDFKLNSNITDNLDVNAFAKQPSQNKHNKRRSPDKQKEKGKEKNVESRNITSASTSKPTIAQTSPFIIKEDYMGDGESDPFEQHRQTEWKNPPTKGNAQRKAKIEEELVFSSEEEEEEEVAALHRNRVSEQIRHRNRSESPVSSGGSSGDVDVDWGDSLCESGGSVSLSGSLSGGEGYSPLVGSLVVDEEDERDDDEDSEANMYRKELVEKAMANFDFGKLPQDTEGKGYVLLLQEVPEGDTEPSSSKTNVDSEKERSRSPSPSSSFTAATPPRARASQTKGDLTPHVRWLIDEEETLSEGRPTTKSPSSSSSSSSSSPSLSRFMMDDYYGIPSTSSDDGLQVPSSYPRSKVRVVCHNCNLVVQFYDGLDWALAPEGFTAASSPSSVANSSMSNSLGNDGLLGEGHPVSGSSGMFSSSSSFASAKAHYRGTRNENEHIAVHLMGIKAQMDELEEGTIYVRRVAIAVQNVEVRDHISNSVINKFLCYDEDHPREVGASMLRIEMECVRPDAPVSNTEEWRMKVAILPLRFYVDQDALEFLGRYFSRMEQSPLIPETEPMYFQSCEVKPLKLKVDYYPKRFDYNALYGENKAMFLVKATSLKTATFRLKGIKVKAKGWEELLAKKMVEQYEQYFVGTQLYSVLSAVGPIRSLLNLGSGVSDIIYTPYKQWQRDGNMLSGIAKGMTSGLQKLTVEGLNVTTNVAAGVQYALESADYLLGGSRSTSRSSAASTSNASSSSITTHSSRNPNLLSSSTSRYVNQPRGARDGVVHAYQSLSRELGNAAHRIVAVPLEEYEREGARGYLSSLVGGVPVAILRPMIGVTEGVTKTLVGVSNWVDPSYKKQMSGKFKDGVFAESKKERLQRRRRRQLQQQQQRPRGDGDEGISSSDDEEQQPRGSRHPSRPDLLDGSYLM